MKACSLTQHAADLGSIVEALTRTPVLIGHSFGGLVVQRSGQCSFFAIFQAVTLRTRGVHVSCAALGRLLRKSPGHQCSKTTHLAALSSRGGGLYQGRAISMQKVIRPAVPTFSCTCPPAFLVLPLLDLHFTCCPASVGWRLPLCLLSICCACRYVTGPAEEHEAESLPPIAGLALLCAAPATGNDELVKRVARKSLVKAAKMTWCATAKGWEAFH